MSWYDQFARFYNASLEKLYAPHRARLCAMLDDDARLVVDFPCGTGLTIPYLQRPAREIVGVDRSEKMAARPRRRPRGARR